MISIKTSFCEGQVTKGAISQTVKKLETFSVPANHCIPAARQQEDFSSLSTVGKGLPRTGGLFCGFSVVLPLASLPVIAVEEQDSQ
jgi:hypothetical protein